MSSVVDDLKRKMESYVKDGVRKRYDAKEKERAEFEGSDFSSYNHGGNWDVPFDPFSAEIASGVLQVAANERESDALLDLVFGRVKIVPGASGGDHHYGWFQDYNVLTEDARGLAQDSSQLRSLLESSEPLQ